MIHSKCNHGYILECKDLCNSSLSNTSSYVTYSDIKRYPPRIKHEILHTSSLKNDLYIVSSKYILVLLFFPLVSTLRWQMWTCWDEKWITIDSFFKRFEILNCIKESYYTWYYCIDYDICRNFDFKVDGKRFVYPILNYAVDIILIHLIQLSCIISFLGA